MSNENCGNCKFYKRGACVRFPPVLLEMVYGEQRFGHVMVWPEDWCGEWKQKNLSDTEQTLDKKV